MDKGDWIYLLFAAIAVIISIYKRATKKREAEETSAGPSIPEVYEEEDDWLPSPEYRQPQPIRAQPRPLPEEAPRQFLNTVPSEPEPPVMQEDDSQAAFTAILSDSDEARKAFIYAEILNRKY